MEGGIATPLAGCQIALRHAVPKLRDDSPASHALTVRSRCSSSSSAPAKQNKETKSSICSIGHNQHAHARKLCTSPVHRTQITFSLAALKLAIQEQAAHSFVDTQQQRWGAEKAKDSIEREGKSCSSRAFQSQQPARRLQATPAYSGSRKASPCLWCCSPNRSQVGLQLCPQHAVASG